MNSYKFEHKTWDENTDTEVVTLKEFYTNDEFDPLLLDITDFLKAVGYEFPAGTTLGVVEQE